jgi:hypothetical protein
LDNIAVVTSQHFQPFDYPSLCFSKGAVHLSHAKAYRNFLAENRRLQDERIAAFSEYIADVKEGRFPEPCHLVEMDTQLLDEAVRSIPARNTATTRGA